MIPRSKQAESEELRRARELDRQDEDEEEEEEEEEYNAPMGRSHSRHPSMSAGVPDAGYDPNIEAKLAGLGFGNGTRSRRPSNAASMGMGMPGGPHEQTYGGAPFGAPPNGAPFGAPPNGAPFGAPPNGPPFGAPPNGAPFGAPPPNGGGMRPGMPQGPGPGGIIPTGAGAPGGPVPGGIIPGAAGGGVDGYMRDRRISQRSMRDGMNAAAGLPGLAGLGAGLGGGGLSPSAAGGVPGAGPGAGPGSGPYMKSPNGQFMPLGDQVSPQRTPISQIPPSPGHALGRRSPYAAPTYGGLPPGAPPGVPPGAPPGVGGAGPIVPAGGPPSAQASIGQYGAAQAFARQPSPGSRYSPFKPFPIFNDMEEMYDTLPEVPPLPAALVDHDVRFEDWARWMTVSNYCGASCARIFAHDGANPSTGPYWRLATN